MGEQLQEISHGLDVHINGYAAMNCELDIIFYGDVYSLHVLHGSYEMQQKP